MAADALSFEVAAGTVTGFLGHKGAGKTTTNSSTTVSMSSTEKLVPLQRPQPSAEAVQLEGGPLLSALRTVER